jgi:hypothetical protein
MIHEKPIQLASPLPEWLVGMVESCQHASEETFKAFGEFRPILLKLKKEKIAGAAAFDPDALAGVMYVIENYLKEKGCQGVFFTCEAWFAIGSKRDRVDSMLAPSLRPDRREVIIMRLFLPGGRQIHWASEIIRHPDKQAELQPWEVFVDTAHKDAGFKPMDFSKPQHQGYDLDKALDKPEKEKLE